MRRHTDAIIVEVGRNDPEGLPVTDPWVQDLLGSSIEPCRIDRTAAALGFARGPGAGACLQLRSGRGAFGSPDDPRAYGWQRSRLAAMLELHQLEL